MSAGTKQPPGGNRTPPAPGGTKPTPQPAPNGSQTLVQDLDLNPGETRELLRQWERGLHVKYVAHAREATVSERKRRWLGVPVVVLSTLVGTAFFTTVKNTYTNTYVQLGLGFLGVVAGLLAAV